MRDDVGELQPQNCIFTRIIFPQENVYKFFISLNYIWFCFSNDGMEFKAPAPHTCLSDMFMWNASTHFPPMLRGENVCVCFVWCKYICESMVESE